MRASKTLDGKTYGVGKLAFEKLKVLETIDGKDSIDWDTFNSGNYVLMTRFMTDKDETDFLKPGDMVQIRSYDSKYMETLTDTDENGKEYEYVSYENAPVKEYEVYGIVEIPLALGLRGL